MDNRYGGKKDTAILKHCMNSAHLPEELKNCSCLLFKRARQKVGMNGTAPVLKRMTWRGIDTIKMLK